jgi:hypothetical protein
VRKVLIGCIPVLLVALLAGCGQPSSAAHSAATAPTATATAIPAAMTPPTPTNTIGVVDSGHPCSGNTSGLVSYKQIGDLKVSEVGFLLDYPANALPAGLDPSKPYQLPATIPNPPNPPVNPSPNYSFTICNTSHTTSHVLRSVTVRIAAFSAYSGSLNTWMFCDSYYQRPDGVAGSGCGGGYTVDEELQATFAANATTGVQATAIVTGTQNAGSDPNGPPVPPLPVRLGPGQQLYFALALTTPTVAGTYSFAFALSYDTVTATPISTMQPTLLDSAAVKWSGQNCTRPALLAQIPTGTTSPGKYVCAP